MNVLPQKPEAMATAASSLPNKPKGRSRSNDKPVLLIVEDDLGLQAQLKWAYPEYRLLFAADRQSALALVRAEEPAVVTLDLGLPPDPDGVSEGLAVLDAILAMKPDTKVIIASGHDERSSAREAIARGAYDFYPKPVVIEDLRLIVNRAHNLHQLEAENQTLAAQLPGNSTQIGGLISAAPEMLTVTRMVERVAATSASVVLLGASGTGKELLAKGLHEASERAGKPFVAINCAVIPETLLESELFGYEKGAFTGAVKTTEGKIELADGGTLFLDEVGDIPFSLQVKLLRFLQERVIERLGGRKAVPVDVRVVCATHQDLTGMQAEGTFREDLYYRLAEVIINVPPLVDRSGDAVLLANSFLKRFSSEMNSQAQRFSKEALAAIAAWPWPGNVRELENRVKRAMIMADSRSITPQDLDLPDGTDSAVPTLPLNLKSAREATEKRCIQAALAHCDGTVSSAAALLGISRPTLYDLIKHHGLQP